MPLQRGLEEMNEHAHDQPADNRDEYHPVVKVVMRGITDGEGKAPVKKDIGEQVDQFQQPLRHQPADHAHQHGINANLDDLRFERDAELAAVVSRRLQLILDLGGKSSHLDLP